MSPKFSTEKSLEKAIECYKKGQSGKGKDYLDIILVRILTHISFYIMEMNDSLKTIAEHLTTTYYVPEPDAPPKPKRRRPARKTASKSKPKPKNIEEA